MSSGDSVVLIAFLAIVFMVSSIGGVFKWGEHEGTINTSDCRARYSIEESDRRFWDSFTCNTFKTDTGKVMHGSCERVELNNSWFASTKECLAVFSYRKKPEVTCGKEHPWLDKNGNCYEDSGAANSVRVLTK